MNPGMYCETCDRIERNPIMLDVETCSRCGGNLHNLEDVADDGQPDEMTEWLDFNPDC